MRLTNKRKQILELQLQKIKRLKGFLREAEIEKQLVEELFAGFDEIVKCKGDVLIRTIYDDTFPGSNLILQLEVKLPKYDWRIFLEVHGRAYQEANSIQLSIYADPFLILDKNKINFNSEDAIYYTRIWLADVFPELAKANIILEKEKQGENEGEQISENEAG